jgi:hypothetical protein
MSVLETHAPLQRQLTDQEGAIEWFGSALEEIEENALLHDFLDGHAASLEGLFRLAENQGLRDELETLVSAARDGGLYVSPRHVRSTDGRWMLVAPDRKGLRMRALMYFVRGGAAPQTGEACTRVERDVGYVAKLLGLAADSQQGLFGKAKEYVTKGSAEAFVNGVVKPFATKVADRLASEHAT